MSRRVELYSVEANDPHGELVDRTGVGPEQLERIGRLMTAMGRLRTVEGKVFEAGQQYMRLKETDMLAIQFLIACFHQNVDATPGMLAAHLRITPASTTKLLDRLENSGHVVRSRSNLDRRTVTVTVTPHTRLAAMNAVGRHHAARFAAAAALTESEIKIVTRFLAATADDMEATLLDEGSPPSRDG